ncbi:TlpA family protein disulfide reductase, partial [bacterium]
AVGEVPPALPEKDIQDRPVSFDGYKGKVVLLHFWSPRPTPGADKIGEVKRLYDEYHAQGLEAIGVSLFTYPQEVEAYAKGRQMSWPQICDGKSWSSPLVTTFAVKALPYAIIIGKDGKIAAVDPEGHLEDAVKAALAGPG